jgi:SHS2 domain-containing protein
MHRFTIEQNPTRIQAFGSTRAGLMVAAVKGLFASQGIESPEGGEELKRSFSLEEVDTKALLLAMLGRATAESTVNREVYHDVSFTLITDRKAVGSFVGKKLSTAPTIASVTGVDGEISKEADGMWRATITL